MVLRLVQYLEPNNLSEPLKSDYKRFHCCETALPFNLHLKVKKINRRCSVKTSSEREEHLVLQIGIYGSEERNSAVNQHVYSHCCFKVSLTDISMEYSNRRNEEVIKIST